MAAHGKDAKISIRHVPAVPKPSVVGRRSAITMNRFLKKTRRQACLFHPATMVFHISILKLIYNYIFRHLFI